MAKNSAEYWARRFDQIEQGANNQSKKFCKQLEREYKNAERELNNKINKWYERIAVNNNIDPADARKFLTTSELKDFRMTLEEYIQKGRENAINGKWIKELENASAKVHIQRLEALKLEARHQIEMLMPNYQYGMNDLLWNVYEDSYYKSIFEVQKGIGAGFNVAKLDKNAVKRVLNNPWAVDGQNFSDRIWTNKNKLVNTLNNEMTRLCLTGEKPDNVIKTLSNTMNTSLSNAKRLVHTEQAYFTTRAQNDSYKELGIEQYEVIATLDDRTCDECAPFDGGHYPIKDLKVGVNAPPFHPNCRCTTAPYFDDNFADGLRASRDENGKTVFTVPEKMTFAEWKNAHVVDNAGVLAVNTQCSIYQAMGDKQYNEMHDVVNNAPEDVRTLWNKYEADLELGDANYKGVAHCTYDGVVNMDVKKSATHTERPYRTFFHEFGHALDHKLGGGGYISLTHNNGAFGESLRKEFDALVKAEKEKLKAEFLANINAEKNAVWLVKRQNIFSKEIEKCMRRQNVRTISNETAYKSIRAQYAGVNRQITSELSDIMDGLSGGGCNLGFGHSKSYWRNANKVPIEAFANMHSSKVTNGEAYEHIKKMFPNSVDIFEEIIQNGIK